MKRWIFIILLSLILVSGGAIVNVAVAWGFAVFVELPEDFQFACTALGDERAWWVARQDGPGASRVTVQLDLGDCCWERKSEDLAPHWGGWDKPPAVDWEPVIAWWEDSSDEPPPNGWNSMTGFMWYLEGRGWPMLASWCEMDWNDGTESSTTMLRGGGIWFPPVADVYHEYTGLPLRPIWPGFLINTLFYAIILWLLIRGPFALRRLIRIKRGRCPKCGYDLRGAPGSGCSECGWNRPPEAVAGADAV